MTLEARLRAFDETRWGLLDELEALPADVLMARPLTGKWSMIEIVEHLVLAERVVYQGLPAPAQLVERERLVKHRVSFLLVLFILTTGLRVRMPSAAMAPRGGYGLDELRRRWDENQAWLRSCRDHLGEAGLRRAVLEHPVAGPLTLEQAVRMAQRHLEGHIRQVRTLRRLLG